MIIRRAPRSEGAHHVGSDHGVYDDPRLSWGARGLMNYLLGQSVGWTAAVEHLESAASGINGEPNDDQAIRTLLRELMIVGYVQREEIRRDDTTVAAVEYRVSKASCEIDIDQVNEAIVKLMNPGRGAGRPSEVLRRLD